MNPLDPLHTKATNIFELILSSKEVRSVIPTTAFYEVLFVLLKAGVPYKSAKDKLMKLMMIEDVINYTVTEPCILKMAFNAKTLIGSVPEKTNVRAHDLMLLTIAMDHENSCFITGDKEMKDYRSVYENVFLFYDPGDIKKIESFLSS